MKPRKKTPARRTRPAPVPPIDISDYAHLALARMPAMVRDFITGGAADELTLRWNREAYDRIRLRPRNLVDVSRLDTRVTLFGREMPGPILLAPVAYQRLLHPDGEAATARGAAAAGATMVMHATSGDVSGDYDRVVGYAGMIIPCGN